ncbi:hypothetical protein A3Q56_00786 [Intoshia linei]|uniref:UBR-type domain-containing protein n=1 Tax=Intoshia linei TaxID=1819745 RepID=A0A177BB61_9BILA|nr:hypothetical protein A3Q56_00786 [Intoshia linei]
MSDDINNAAKSYWKDLTENDVESPIATNENSEELESNSGSSIKDGLEPTPEISQTRSDSVKNDDDSVSMLDVIRYHENIDEKTNSLVGEDEKRCSYKQGYMHRQLVYSCVTCQSGNDNDLAGICFSCSLNCHDGHDLYELYTKRNFRCDCGNSKFTQECSLQKEKEKVNDKNIYGQNFIGLYCFCHKKYPDESNHVEMIHCVSCEDWYHVNHIETTFIVDPDSFSEFLCPVCTKKLIFLKKYSMSIDALIDFNKKKLQNTNCSSNSAFFIDGWRKKISESDKKLLDEAGCSFICSNIDTIAHYRENLKNENKTTFQKSMDALTTMPKATQMSMLNEYQHMKEELVSHLSDISKQKRTVNANDITDFFTALKRRRLNKEYDDY